MQDGYAPSAVASQMGHDQAVELLQRHSEAQAEAQAQAQAQAQTQAQNHVIEMQRPDPEVPPPSYSEIQWEDSAAQPPASGKQWPDTMEQPPVYSEQQFPNKC